jgi:hypothetical protein
MRLNFQVTDAAEQRIADYCNTTGRTASDIVRQLVCEYLEGFRSLGSNVPALNGKRTNCTLTQGIVDRLDMRVRAIGSGATKGLVISNLLEDWQPDNVLASELLAELVEGIQENHHGTEKSNRAYKKALEAAEIYLGRGQKDGRS